MKKTKIKVMAFVMTMVMILTVIPFSVFAEGKKDVTIGTLSDIHYYANSLKGNRTEAYQHQVAGSTTTLDLTADCLDTALKNMAKELEGKKNPYLLIPGDLSYQGEYESHAELVAKLEKWEKETGIDVIVINGNHDINNAKAYTFENDVKEKTRETSPEDFRELYKNLGYDIAYHTYTPPEGKQQGGMSYSVRLDGGYRVIVMDANIYSSDCTKDGSDEHETRQALSDDLFKWVLKECEDAKSKGEEIIGMSHSPLIDHVGSYQSKLLTGFIIADWEDKVTSLVEAGMHFTFVGHQHLSDIASYVTDSGETIYECEIPPTGTYPCGMYVTNFTSEGGKTTAEYNYHDIDELSPVVLYGEEQPYPFKNSAFGKAYGNGDVTALAMNIVRYNLGSVFDGIKEAGGILEYLELEGIDLEKVLSDAFEGISVGPIDIFTAENIMLLADDLCDQLYDTYLKDTEVLYAFVEEIVDKIVSIQMSEVPCTHFIDTLGFGDETRGGNLGDVVLSFLAYMFGGQENLAEDEFFSDVLYRFKNDTSLPDTLFNSLLDIVLYDLLLEDGLLSNLELNVDSAFPIGKVGFLLGKIVDALLTVILGGDKSFTNIIDFVFDLGVLKWDSIEDVRADLMGEYFTESQYQAIGIEFYTVISAFLDDKNPKPLGDQDVTYTYDGKVEPEVTADNFRAPSIITVTYGEDSSSSFNISWYTKKTVRGTDIEIVPYSSNPVFTGKPTKSSSIETETKTVMRETPAIDFGVIGIVAVETDMTRHIIKLTNLEPDTKYCYRVGDADRGWWSDVGVLETADNSREATFLHVTDTQAQNSEQFDAWADMLKVANKTVDYDFILSTGDQVDSGSNVKLWKYFANNASHTLLNKPFMPTAGNHEKMNGGNDALGENFVLPNVPEQDLTEGTYYSFDYNNIHIAVLNTNNLSEKEDLSKDQLQWLTEDMNSSDAEWKFVALHKAIYSNGSHFDDDDVVALRKQLSKLMPELDIDLVFQGHDHVYMRTDSMINNKVVPAKTTKELSFDGLDYTAKVDPEGSIYTITGCAGVKYYLPKDNAETDALFPRAEAIVVSTLPTFASIKVRGNTLYFDAYNVDGEEANRIDSFAIVKTDLEEYVPVIKKEKEVNSIEDMVEVIVEGASDAVETGDVVPYVAFIVLPLAAVAVAVTFKRKKKTEQK